MQKRFDPPNDHMILAFTSMVVVMDVPIKMHSVVCEWVTSTESLPTIDSQRTCLPSRKNCAFRWLQFDLYSFERSRQEL